MWNSGRNPFGFVHCQTKKCLKSDLPFHEVKKKKGEGGSLLLCVPVLVTVFWKCGRALCVDSVCCPWKSAWTGITAFVLIALRYEMCYLTVILAVLSPWSIFTGQAAGLEERLSYRTFKPLRFFLSFLLGFVGPRRTQNKQPTIYLWLTFALAIQIPGPVWWNHLELGHGYPPYKK